MWRQFLQSLPGTCKFHPPADSTILKNAQDVLAVQFPSELLELFAESNGVTGEYGLGLVWPVERICADNISFRSKEAFRELYMPFESLLFFADDGGGDQFSFSLNGGVIRRPDVFVWNHEDDSRTWVAPSLRIFLEWLRTNRIKY